MAAREEMSRFGFCQDQEPHPIFHKLSTLYHTHPKSELHSRRLEREVCKVETEIEQSMEDAERDYQRRLADQAWQQFLDVLTGQAPPDCCPTLDELQITSGGSGALRADISTTPTVPRRRVPANERRYPPGCPDPDYCSGNGVCFWECNVGDYDEEDPW